MALTEKDVQRVAELVRVRLDDSEVAPLAAELSKIFEWIEELREVDVEGVGPMASVVEMQLRERGDEVRDGDRRDEVLANAPEAEEGCFVVPRVIE